MESSRESTGAPDSQWQVNRVVGMILNVSGVNFNLEALIIYIRNAGFHANDAIHPRGRGPGALVVFVDSPVDSLNDSIPLPALQELPWSVLGFHIYGKSSQEASQWTCWALDPTKPPQSSPPEQSFFSIPDSPAPGNEG